MAQVKRIMICVPDSLLEEVDGIVVKESRNRSEFIREAMKMYIREKKRRELREAMRRGYSIMGELNRAIAEEGMATDRDDLRRYERYLTESD